jgi:hypothetical protein
MPVARFEMPDGRIGRFEVPEGTTPEQAQVLIAQSLPQPAPEKPGMLRNIGMGALKGASDIGSTLLRPVDAALNAAGLTQTTNADRRAGLRSFFRENADTDSLAFKGAELAADIAGTAGVGGVLAKPVAAIAPRLAAALSSGGFSLGGGPAATTLAGRAGDAALRAAGGAAVGGASAGLIDPSMAGTGAAIGAVLPGAIRAAGLAGKKVADVSGVAAKNLLGLSTGTGANAVGTAYQAGKAGEKAFLENMRGKVPITDVLDDAKNALSNMRVQRGNEYRQGMANVSADKTVLDMTPIESALNSVKSMGLYKGQQINKNAAGTVGEIEQQIATWSKLNPAEYHTPEGLDALKKAIGDIRDATEFGSAGRKAADTVYNSVKNEIAKQAPTYAKTMKSYSEASDLITEIEKALSLGNKASADTSMRKLQSLMRNNVNTNYGNRLNLASELEQQGGANILPAVAGQAMSSAAPRGLQGLAATGTGALGIVNPAVLAALPFQSPRLVGEAAYGLGRLSSTGGNAANAAIAGSPILQQLMLQQGGNNPTSAALRALLYSPASQGSQ